MRSRGFGSRSRRAGQAQVSLLDPITVLKQMSPFERSTAPGVTCREPAATIVAT
jgi:hypothetical protein